MAEQSKKIVRKKFFDVSIPLTASKVKLYASNEQELNNRVANIDMTKNLKGKNVELKARIIYKDGKLDSELVSLIVLPSYIRRTMRRGIDYIEDSFKTSCKDAELIIKPFMITRNHISRNLRKEVRNATRKFLEGYSNIKTVKELFSELMTNKLQRSISLKVKKIYPLAFCEIRWIEVIGPPIKKKTEVQEEPVETTQ
ncbi:hypothetical protein J4423_04270 [Candidatus Pacearchaeota archaeon]|nr:hypothetical protein [Candidatus Pacearchaeota archaeon]